MVLLACFVSAAQDLSSSPSLETADSGLSEHSVSLLSDAFQQKLQSLFSEREVVQGKKYHCDESVTNEPMLITARSQSAVVAAAGMLTVSVISQETTRSQETLLRVQ